MFQIRLWHKGKKIDINEANWTNHVAATCLCACVDVWLPLLAPVGITGSVHATFEAGSLMVQRDGSDDSQCMHIIKNH